MNTGYAGIRNLLYVVIVLVVFAILSNYYVASQIARNSDELAGLRLLIAKQLMGNVLDEAEQVRMQLDAINENAKSIDAKLRKAQDDFVSRMQVELPKIMDAYIKQRSKDMESLLPQEIKDKVRQPPPPR